MKEFKELHDMDDVKLMPKKYLRIGIRLSSSEREMIDAFCKEKGIQLSHLIRHAVRKVLKEYSGKK